jgi:cytoskeletal protein CcmA (bactofilin family)
MWKKDDNPQPTNEPTVPKDGGARAGNPARTASVSTDQATIGRSITIRGDVTGDEDLIIQGRVEGTVDLKQHNVTVGPEGRVKADVAARTVTIEGEVTGNVRGQEQVSLRSPSKVTGDIEAPRVVLEDGATFLGNIDMSGKTATSVPPKPAAEPKKADQAEPKSTPSAIRTSTAKA